MRALSSYLQDVPVHNPHVTDYISGIAFAWDFHAQAPLRFDLGCRNYGIFRVLRTIIDRAPNPHAQDSQWQILNAYYRWTNDLDTQLYAELRACSPYTNKSAWAQQLQTLDSDLALLQCTAHYWDAIRDLYSFALRRHWFTVADHLCNKYITPYPHPFDLVQVTIVAMYQPLSATQ